MMYIIVCIFTSTLLYVHKLCINYSRGHMSNAIIIVHSEKEVQTSTSDIFIVK